MSPAAGTWPQRQPEDAHTLSTQMPRPPISARIPAALPVETRSTEDKMKALTLTAQIRKVKVTVEDISNGFVIRVSKYSVSLIYPRTHPSEKRKLVNAHVFH